MTLILSQKYSIHEGKKDVVCIYTMECYSVVKKRDEILPFTTMWMDLEEIMLSEISWRETPTI